MLATSCAVYLYNTGQHKDEDETALLLEFVDQAITHVGLVTVDIDKLFATFCLRLTWCSAKGWPADARAGNTQTAFSCICCEVDGQHWGFY